MTTIEEFLRQWRDARNGLVNEVERLPEDQLTYRAAPETRSALEILQHIIDSERMLVGEICRDDTDLGRLLTRPPDDEVQGVTAKEAVLTLLASSLAASSEKMGRFGTDKLAEQMRQLDGQQVSKMAMLQFTLAHEMYHRGQLTVYLRLLGIEPALTEQFKKFRQSSG